MKSHRDSPRLDDVEYAVIDFETTGLFPRRGDRVVEVGLVLLAADGRTECVYQTLVNPQRDIGPTRIHGIRAKDVLDAPLFVDIVGDLIALLEGRVVVAHNARFDLDFLAHEFARIGLTMPAVSSLCTLQLSRLLMSGGHSRRLVDLCSEVGIQFNAAHSAATDAEATARLLNHLLDLARASGVATLVELGCELADTPSTSWPPSIASGRAKPRSQATIGDTRASPLASLIGRLPSTGEPSGVPTGYLELLDRVLEDREVRQREASALSEVATTYGLTREGVIAIHQDYLRRAVSVAKRDDLVSTVEHQDLVDLTALLGLPAATLVSAMASPLDVSPTFETSAPDRRAVLAGLSVCFTGDSSSKRQGVVLSRLEAEALALEAGLIPVKTVTKSLGILVLADPSSQSSKARLARKYGVRLVAELEFWQMIGVVVQ